MVNGSESTQHRADRVTPPRLLPLAQDDTHVRQRWADPRPPPPAPPPYVQAEGPRQKEPRKATAQKHEDSGDKGPVCGEGVSEEMEQPCRGWTGKLRQKLSPRLMPHGPRDTS